MSTSFLLVKPDAVATMYEQVWPPLGALEVFFILWVLKHGVAGVGLAASPAKGQSPLLFAGEFDMLE